MSSKHFLAEFFSPTCVATDTQGKKQPVIDVYHGVKVADPYRWLEDLDSEETRAWVNGQNRTTATYFDSIPELPRIRDDLTTRWDYPTSSVPMKRGNRTFFWYNSGLQPQPVLLMHSSEQAEPTTLLDPNALSKDGTVAINTLSLNRDGTLMVYGLATDGRDQQELHIRRIDESIDYPEILLWTRYSSIAWTPNSLGFYYTRYPEPGTVSSEDETHFHRVYYHSLGTSQAEDRLIFERPDAKELVFDPIMTDDETYLLLRTGQGTDPNVRWSYREAASDGPFLPLLDKADANYRFLGHKKTLFFFFTTLDAPRGRVIGIDLAHPEREHWREIIPQQADSLHMVRMVNHQFVAILLHDVHHVLHLYSSDGEFVRAIPLPLGSINGITGKTHDHELFFRLTSFLTPGTIYRYDFLANNLEVFRQSSCRFDASSYTTTQAFYPSKDGTLIPLFLTHRKDLVLDGTHPTLLCGYGGFRNSQLPAFSIVMSYWLEHGGIYAVANLRGGSEYGEEWHEAGMFANKQNVFDDFLAAAEWLIAQRYTAPSHLAINGGSNGGLLVAACMVQHPDLFGAVICRVPVIDMLRYHTFGVGHYWTAEYGNAETSAEHFRFLSAYSPLHHVQPGTTYPPTLILSAEADDRVSPAHAFKFTAALHDATDGKSPILLHVQPRTGHGVGRPTAKSIEQWSLIFAFLFHLLHLPDSSEPENRRSMD